MYREDVNNNRMVTCVRAWEAGVYIEPCDVSSEHRSQGGCTELCNVVMLIDIKIDIDIDRYI